MANEGINVVHLDSGWMGIYRDGELIFEGHSISTTELLRLLGFVYGYYGSEEIDESYYTDCGRNLPERFEDLKFEVA